MESRTPTYLRYNEKYVARPSGFQNTGTICWWNSLLQSFLSCTSMNEYLLKNKEQFVGKNRLAAEYIALLEKLLAPGDNIDTTLGSIHTMNGYLYEVRAQKEKRLRIPNGQEGVQDYFADFFDLFNDPGLENLFNNKYEYILQCEKCHKIVVNKRNDAKDTFIDIPRDARSFSSRADFCNWVLRHYELLDEYKCECGHVNKKIVRAQQLRMLREVIVVFNKWKFNLIRWLPRYLQFPAIGGTTLTYKLVSQIEHSGTARTIAGGQFMMATGGHYYCHALRDKYYTFNDSHVQPVEPKPSPQTTVLFYHLLGADTVLETEELSPA